MKRDTRSCDVIRGDVGAAAVILLLLLLLLAKIS